MAKNEKVKRPVGHPPAGDRKRVVLHATVAPETLRRLRELAKGERSVGRVIDRLVSEAAKAP